MRLPSKLVKILLIALTFSAVSPLAYGSGISSAPGQSQASFMASSAFIAFTNACPRWGLTHDTKGTVTPDDDVFSADCETPTPVPTTAPVPTTTVPTTTPVPTTTARTESTTATTATRTESTTATTATRTESTTATTATRTESTTATTKTETATATATATTSNPFPGIAQYGEIPGTKIFSARGQSQASFMASSAFINLKNSCPVGSGHALTHDTGGTPSPSDDIFSIYCVNLWTPISAPTTTTKTDTSAVTTNSKTDTSTVTTITTVTTRTETTTASAVKIAAVAAVASISNTKERTAAAVDLIKTFDSVDKENSLEVTLKSSKSSVINVDLAVPGIPVVITATKKGSPTITLKSTTDVDGDAQIKTTKNLEGYSVALTVNKTKIDTDVVKKKK